MSVTIEYGKMKRAEPGIRAPGPALTTSTNFEGWHVMATRNSSGSFVTYKAIRRLPGCRVGDDGSVWRREYSRAEKRFSGKYRRLPQSFNARGYAMVSIRHEGNRRCLLVHRLVLEAFVGPCPEGMECCHDDGNPSHNWIENLRLDTHAANMADARRHGTIHSKLDEFKVSEIRSLYRRKHSVSKLAERYSVSADTIRKIIKRQLWKPMD